MSRAANGEALWGSAQTIAHYTPKLMVSLYHRNEDMFSLPLLIQKLNPNYDIYIRHQLYIPGMGNQPLCRSQKTELGQLFLQLLQKKPALAGQCRVGFFVKKTGKGK